MSKADDHLADWIAAYLSGVASEEEVNALEELLSKDPRARRQFLEHARMDAALSGESQLSPESLPFPKDPVPFSTPNRKARLSLALAAILAISTLLGILVISKTREGVSTRILAASGLAAETFHPGKSMRIRDVRVVQGTVKMRLSSGVIVDLHGPVETEFTDPMRALLKSGNVTFDMADATATKFVVESPTLRIVDQGTKFGVSYRDNGETDIAVLDGEVSVFKQSESKQPLATLREGDAVQIDSRYESRRLAAVSLDGLSLAILEGNGKNTSVVKDVTDSIREADFRRFYAISPGAMGPGVRPYSTLGKPRWQAMQGQNFPEELIGSDVVATFSLDRFDPDLELTLSLTDPATVFLMMDSRAAVPDWLAKGFEKTDLKLRAGPWGEQWTNRVIKSPESERGYIHFEVWKQTVTDREVHIGSPYAGNSTRETAMYGIAVKRLETIQ